MIDLLVTGIGIAVGAGAGAACGWAARRFGEAPRGFTRFGGVGGAALGGFVCALLSAPPSTAQRLDASGPAMQAIHKYYPDTFAQMVAASEGPSFQNAVILQGQLRPLVATLIAAHRSEMDDDTAQAMGQLMLDEADALKASNPQVCVAILTGKPVAVDLRSLVSAHEIRRDSEVTAKLVEQVATHPANPPSPLSEAENEALSTRALGKLTNGDQDIVISLLQQRRKASTAREAAAVCAFHRARFGAALDSSPGTLRRLLLG